MGGPCPIHGGGTRSACLSVQPEKGTWHCFTCGKGGSAFDWMMEVYGLTFPEALEDLSKRTGIALPEEKGQKVDSQEARILSALVIAQDFFASWLRKSPMALDYVRGRGLSEGIIEDEGIGFAPAGWDNLLQHLHMMNVSPELAEAAGLATRSHRGTMIDFLRDRITVPIKDARGRVIAFGGRMMPGAPEGTPKYMNSRETPVFHKGETVFGLHRARSFLRDEGALVVEGYFDVLSLWDQGLQTAVAPLGTSLTDGHLRALKKWTSRITYAFDGDEAGEKATARALELALPQGFDIRLLTLPKGHDPDTWVQAEGKVAAKAAIHDAPDWATFKIAQATEGKDFRRLEDRIAAAREVAEWIAYLPKDRQAEVQAAAAHELKVTTDQLRPAPRARAAIAPQEKPAPKVVSLTPPDEAVQSLAVLAAKGGAYFQWVEQIPRGWWDFRPGATLLDTLLDAAGDKEALGPALQGVLRAAEASDAIRAAVDPKRLLGRLEREFLAREIQEVMRNLAAQITEDNIANQLQINLNGLRTRLAKLTRGIK
jgi:DNA primase